MLTHAMLTHAMLTHAIPTRCNRHAIHPRAALSLPLFLPPSLSLSPPLPCAGTVSPARPRRPPRPRRGTFPRSSCGSPWTQAPIPGSCRLARPTTSRPRTCPAPPPAAAPGGCSPRRRLKVGAHAWRGELSRFGPGAGRGVRKRWEHKRNEGAPSPKGWLWIDVYSEYIPTLCFVYSAGGGRKGREKGER